MPDIALNYPATPVNVSSAITKPSSGFKQEVKKVMSSIVLFFIVYVLLIIMAICLAAACVYGGFALIIAIPKIITIMVGAGLVGLGVMVFFFLVKFIFAVNRFDHSSSIEIKESEHPRLFSFIRQLSHDTQAPFPKRIYISPEVNACVFYDSSFWSMLLPVKKNLQIGLGLVNSLTLSEFKAVMAHEFGHFSQRSMKLGSFVYNVNRVIYNMLFENKGYGNLLQNWANISGYFAFFAGITAHIVNAIQWVLRQMYAFINKNYMGLSREMEFNADAIAASVSGSNNCISALRRIELADGSYSTVIQKCDEWLKEKCIIQNVYPNHRVVLKRFAKEFKLELKNDLPVVNDDFLKGARENRVNFKNQWASHPTIEERVERLEAVNVIAEDMDETAWVLFENAEDLQRQVTTKLYQHVELPEGVQALDKTAFENKYLNNVAMFSLPAEYKGFYNSRQLEEIDVESLSVPASSSDKTTFDEIFSPEHIALPKKINAIKEDIQLLKAIADKTIRTKTFDFDGEKYERSQASIFAGKLENELADQQKLLKEADEKAFRFFYQLASQKSLPDATRLKSEYVCYFDLRRQAEIFFNDTNAMAELLQPLYAGNVNIDNVNYIIGQLKSGGEPKFKEHLKRWSSMGMFDQNPDLKYKVEKFIAAQYAYFSGESFFNNEIADLNNLINESWNLVNEFIFKKFKVILDSQLELMKNEDVINNPIPS